MHDRVVKLRRNDKSVPPDTGVIYLVLPVIVVIVVVALIASEHPASNWIAQAVEAEFGNDALAPSGPPTPTQLAQPAAAPRDSNVSIRAAYGAQR